MEADGARAACPSVVEAAGKRLVELEVGDGLGIEGVEGRGLVEQEIVLPTHRQRPREVTRNARSGLIAGVFAGMISAPGDDRFHRVNLQRRVIP